MQREQKLITTKPLNDAEYEKEGVGICPYCHGRNTNTLEQPDRVAGFNDTSATVECYDCGKTWCERWTIAGWFPDDDPPTKEDKKVV